MRTIPVILAAAISSLTLAGCDVISRLDRETGIRECSEFYRNSREARMSEEAIRASCTCAVEREAAGQTPIASVPPRPNPALGDFRRHLPDCLAANGGSASGVAARESSGAAPLATQFDPNTGRWSEPPDQVMPGPGEGEAEAPPPEEPPPSMGDGFPPPIVRDPGARPAPSAAPGTGSGAARPRANLASYVSADDYPPSAARNNEEGRVVFVLDISAEGRVTNCTVTLSSGSAALDSATCRIMRSRARYTPARNNRGEAIAGRDQGAVRWQLAD